MKPSASSPCFRQWDFQDAGVTASDPSVTVIGTRPPFPRLVFESTASGHQDGSTTTCEWGGSRRPPEDEPQAGMGPTAPLPHRDVLPVTLEATRTVSESLTVGEGGKPRTERTHSRLPAVQRCGKEVRQGQPSRGWIGHQAPCARGGCPERGEAREQSRRLDSARERPPPSHGESLSRSPWARDVRKLCAHTCTNTHGFPFGF